MKSLLIEAIYINLCLSTMINAYILMTEKDTMKEFLKQIKKPLYNDYNDDGRFEKYHRDYKPRELKRKLVRKLIPHVVERPFYEYDTKYRTIYRPLFQIRKSKHVNEIHKLLESYLKKYLNKVKFYKRNNENLENIYDSRCIIKEYPIHVLGDRELSMESFKTESPKRNKGTTGYRLYKINNLPIKSIENVLKRIQIENPMRRIFTKSIEMQDHLAPGAFTIMHSHEIDKEKPPEKRLPKYPFWNYWTYKKQIYHDQCPMNTVKNQDGVCIRVLPH